ncbi:DNRLRE domain-containing protein [Vagococcus silagei]|uniref:DNRLRE domain-containing protein n=1 Tax=Vagococcus silagei TaxID=2508885 RepID=A0A4S3B234_9ENTE|nr:Ig-like domain-containing protein [Vagococcus silagei]THB61184.1 DNRLRE domain-containing protein [Vagococcus silagei]
MKKIIKLINYLAIMCLTLVSIGSFTLPVHAAEEPLEKQLTTELSSVGLSKQGKTYFVDGQNGEDTSDGLSPETAWKSLEKVSATTFQPGDHILLEAGSTWRGQILHPKGSGTKDATIKLDFYVKGSEGKATFKSNKRPTIHGDGTYGTGKFKRYVTGAVQLVNQEHWEIQNLEVTNTPELDNKEGYKKPGDAQRVGILLLGHEQNRTFNNVKVRNNYVHDVQSEYYLKLSGSRETKRLKAVGGIIVLGHWVDEDGNVVLNAGDHRSTTGFNDVLIENNIVKRVGLEGIRTKGDADTSVANTFHKKFSNITIRNNYLEDISGDAIVLSEVASDGVVEGNVSKRAANADYGTHNYAAVWSMSNDNALFQYNEVYGIVYGYNDAEAYDIDMQCSNVIYQYNYSHHNSGGFLLLMNSQADSIVRYNISANDGGGNKGTNADKGGGSGYNYKEQSIFHYWVKSEGRAMPLIHNNTIYVGDGVSTSLFGEGNSGDNSGTIAHFYNNILYKEGSGSLKFLAANPTNGSDAIERKLGNNPEKYIKNNIIWPESVASEKSGATKDILEKSNNKFVKPKLLINEDQSLVADLNAQEQTALNVETDSVQDFTSVSKLRERTKGFKISDDSPAIASGTVIPNQPEEDFFGNSIKDRAPDIGAHQVSNVKKKKEVKVNPIKVKTLAGVYPELPNKVDVTIKETYGDIVNERKEKKAVTWDIIAKDKYMQAGKFDVSGTVAGLSKETAVAKAEVTVTGEAGTGAESAHYVAKDAAFIQKGNPNDAYGAKQGAVSKPSAKDAYKAPFGLSYSDNYVLKLKNAGSAPYNRRFLVKFNLKDYQGKMNQIKDANIRIFVSRYDAWNGAGGTTEEQLRNTGFALDVYGVGNQWTDQALTWNNAPGNAEVSSKNPDDSIPNYTELKPVSHKEYKNSQIIDNGHAIDIDVSHYLAELDDSVEDVSFLVTIPMSKVTNFDRDNAGFDAFSLKGAAQAYRDFENGTLKLPANFPQDIEMSATTLAPKLYLSNVYEKEVEAINIKAKPGEEVTLPEKVMVTYTNETKKEVKVDWGEQAKVSFTKDGTYKVLGKASGVSLPVVATIDVKGNVIKSFKALPKLDRVVGLGRGALGMPKKVMATLESGEEVEVEVTGWDDDVSNYNENSAPGEYNFPGAVKLPTGVTNPNEEKPTQKVQTHPKPKKISFTEETVLVTAGETQPVTYRVAGEEPFTKTDEWSSAVKWSIEPLEANENSVLPVISEAGEIVTTRETTLGKYKVTAVSTRVETVKNSFTLEVAEAVINKAPLTTLILAAEKRQPSQGHAFTSASKEALDQAIAKAKALLNQPEMTQVELDEMVVELQTALDGLSELPISPTTVDKEELKKIINQAKQLTPSTGHVFTEDSQHKLESELAKADLVMASKTATQAEVNEMVNALQTVIDAMEEEEITEATTDKAELRKIMRAALDKKPSTGHVFTAETREIFEKAILKAQTILDGQMSTQAVIDAMVLELQKAMDQLKEESLKPVVDKTILSELVKKAQAVKPSVNYEFTAASKNVLDQAITRAKKLINETNSTQNEIDAMVSELQKAMDQLKEEVVKPSKVNKAELEKMIAKAENLKPSAGNVFTEKSQQNLAKIIKIAKEIVESTNPTQAEVDKMIKEIKTAIAEMKEIPEETITVNKQVLAEIVKKAQEVKPSKDHVFTKQSAETLQNAIVKAQLLLTKKDVEQKTIDAMVTELQKAIDGLEEAKEVKEEPKIPATTPESDNVKTPNNNLNGNGGGVVSKGNQSGKTLPKTNETQTFVPIIIGVTLLLCGIVCVKKRNKA